MSEPPDNADPKPDDTLPPLDAEAELVTDPLALTMGAMAGAADPLELPEPVLGSDEDDPEARNGANGTHDDDAFAAADTDLPALDAELEAETAPVERLPEPPAPGEASPFIVKQEPGQRRRIWRAIRYVALTTEKPVVEPPPPVIDDRGRLIRKYLFERSFDP